MLYAKNKIPHNAGRPICHQRAPPSTNIKQTNNPSSIVVPRSGSTKIGAKTNPLSASGKTIPREKVPMTR